MWESGVWVTGEHWLTGRCCAAWAAHCRAHCSPPLHTERAERTESESVWDWWHTNTRTHSQHSGSHSAGVTTDDAWECLSVESLVWPAALISVTSCGHRTDWSTPDYRVTADHGSRNKWNNFTEHGREIFFCFTGKWNSILHWKLLVKIMLCSFLMDDEIFKLFLNY